MVDGGKCHCPFVEVGKTGGCQRDDVQVHGGTNRATTERSNERIPTNDSANRNRIGVR